MTRAVKAKRSLPIVQVNIAVICLLSIYMLSIQTF